MTENRQFRSFIIITMILTATHDSAIRWGRFWDRIGRRQIPFVKHGRMIRFDRFALDRWVAKGVRNGFDETR
jgi:hypothetical protein